MMGKIRLAHVTRGHREFQEFKNLRDLQIWLKSEYEDEETPPIYLHWLELLEGYRIEFDLPGDTMTNNHAFVDGFLENGQFYLTVGKPYCYRCYGPYRNPRRFFRNGIRLARLIHRIGAKEYIKKISGREMS